MYENPGYTLLCCSAANALPGPPKENVNPFAEAQRAAFDTSFGQMSQALAGVEHLCALNLQAIKASMVDFEQSAHAALSAKSPAELVQL
jgi:hypothetical protein